MNKFTIKFGVTSILAMALFVSSCNKDNNADIVDGPTVRLNIGQAYADPNSGAVKTASVGRTYTSAIQTVEIPFDNQYTLVATLKAETATSGLKASNRAATVSTGSEKITLKEGTTYYVAIFDAAGNYKETKTFKQGAAATQDFAIDKGQYTFVVYASGTNKSLPTIAVGSKLSDVNFSGLTADQDFMLDQVPFEVKDGVNTLSADLEHLFTQVTLKFDASAVGSVSSIGGATIEPSNKTVDIALADGASTYSKATDKVSFILKNTSGTVISSDSTFITTAAVTDGTIRLSDVSIAGSAKKSITSGNWNLKPGVKYELDITLKAPLGGIEAGGHIWAPGNLVYNNGKYSFAAPNQLGSSWYYNWLTPYGVGTIPGDYDHAYQNMLVYSVDRDPCKMVSSEWRTPTQEDYNSLLATAGAATDYQYKYNGTEGVFYGSNNLQEMSANPTKYVFFPSIVGGTSPYWTATNISGKSNGSTANSLQFGGYNKPSTVSGADNKGNGFQIRCVRN